MQKHNQESKRHADQATRVPGRDATKPDLALWKLADELQRPTFRWAEIVSIVCLTAAPLLFAWWGNNPWFLLGMILPVMLANIIRSSLYRRQLNVLKKVLIWYLPAAERTEFMEALYQGRRLVWHVNRKSEGEEGTFKT